MAPREISLNGSPISEDVPGIEALIAVVQTELAARSAANGTSTAIAAVKQLGKLVQELQTECDSLRRALSDVTEDRDLYLQAAYEAARAAVPPHDIDFDELKRTSAGPIEILS